MENPGVRPTAQPEVRAIPVVAVEGEVGWVSGSLLTTDAGKVEFEMGSDQGMVIGLAFGSVRDQAIQIPLMANPPSGSACIPAGLRVTVCKGH